MEKHCTDEILSAFVDGDLAPVEAGPVSEHVAACSFCRGALTGLKRLREGARELGGLEPSEHTWQAIRERMRHRRVRSVSRWVWFSVPALAAAALLVVAISIRRQAQGRFELRAHRQTPGMTRDELTRDVQQDYKEYVQGIDAAIRECAAALEENPGNPRVRSAYTGARLSRGRAMDRLVSDGD